MSPINRHHLLFERNTYRQDRWLYALRSMPGLIIPLPVAEIHQPLHRVFDAVPPPCRDAAELFVSRIALPYEKGQPWDQTLNQAIGWFDSTSNFGTADHLAAQHEFITERLDYREVA